MDTAATAIESTNAEWTASLATLSADTSGSVATEAAGEAVHAAAAPNLKRRLPPFSMQLRGRIYIMSPTLVLYHI